MIRRLLAIAACTAMGICTPLAAAQEFPAQQPAAGTPRPFTVPASESFLLPNGMQVTLIPYGVAPMATVNLRIYAGPLNQGSDVWLPLLTGRMLEEGAAGRSGGAIAEAAASMGGNLAVNVGQHETVLAMGVLSEHAPDALRLIAAVAQRPNFPAGELDRVRSGLLRDLAVAKSEPGALADAALAAAYYGTSHPYGRLFPTEAQLNSYGVDDLRRFHGSNFGAQRARLFVAGRFDSAAVRAAIEQAYSAWARGPERLRLPPEPRPGPRVILVNRAGAPQSTLRLAFPAPLAGAGDDIPMRVGNALLGGAFSSRITTNIREAKGYTYSPFSTIAFNAGEALWRFNADVTTDVTGAALKEVFHEVRRMQSEPIPQDEAAGMRTYLSGLFVLNNASANGLITSIANRDFHGLPANWLETYIPTVLAVTPADLQRIAGERLALERMTLVVVGDLAKIEPQLKALPELRNAKFERVKAF